MRSYLDIVIDLKDGKDVSKEEIGTALLFAADQIHFMNSDINRMLNSNLKSEIVKLFIVENQEVRFKNRKLPLEKWFGDENIPKIR